MATQKLNTLNAKNVNDLSLKDAKIAVNSKTVELSDKKSVGRVVDLGKKDFFSVSTDKNVSILELTKEMSRDDLINSFKEITERHLDESKEMIVEQSLARAVIDMSTSRIVSSTPGLSLTIDPAGGILCGISYTMKRFSYKLERKVDKFRVIGGPVKQTSVPFEPMDTWETLASRTTIGYAVFLDKDVVEGKKYTYRLTIGTLTPITESITYNNLDIEVVTFEAKPDPTKKKIVIKCNVKNASTIKITRTDNNKELVSPYEDTAVELNKRYEYLLVASNSWNFVRKTAVAECKNLEPSIGSLSYSIEPIERGVTLQWTSVSNASVSAIERKLSTSSTWDRIYSNPSGSSYRDIDESDDQKSIRIGATYDYRVKYTNGWGDSYSGKVSVKMTNKAPNTPRLLPPNGYTLKWIALDNAKSYLVKRIDNSSKSWTVYRPTNCMTDSTIETDKLYTYTIEARNGWGKSDLCYCDVLKPNTENKGSVREIYKYLGQNQNDDYGGDFARKWQLNFQGITTDGSWWYITNGAKGWYTSIRKASVDKTLDRGVNQDYNVPDGHREDGAHVGDLDYYKGYLFVPVYKGDENGKIWIFKTDKNKSDVESDDRLATIEIYKDTYYKTPFVKLGWCAVNPCDGRLYVTDGDCALGPTNPVYSFKINVDKIQQKRWDEVFVDPKQVLLYDENGSICEKQSMQGGCFDYYNNLYLNSGYTETKVGEGIHVFKLIRDDSKQLQAKLSTARTDEARAKIYEAYKSGDLNLPFDCTKGVLIAKSNKTSGFQYQFDPNDGEEPEGMVYCDFKYTDRKPPQEYLKDVSLHAGLLMNSANSIKEFMYFKHYTHLLRDTEEKNVYYNPLNLSVVSATEINDNGVTETVWKVVDNGVLVKKFKSQSYASSALNILKNFKKIHTIGWLYTSSPNHNYEFSAIESNNVLSKTNCTIINYTGSSVAAPVQDGERWVVQLNSSTGKAYYFYAHNSADANEICRIVRNYNKVCIIGAGADSAGPDIGRIRSANNLIWLEK